MEIIQLVNFDRYNRVNTNRTSLVHQNRNTLVNAIGFCTKSIAMRFMTLALATTLLIASCKKGGDSSNPSQPPTPTTTLPTLDTIQKLVIGQTNVSLSSVVLSEGSSPVTTRGICWSTSPNPTIANGTVPVGTITPGFTATITGLSANTQYYFRSYATNAVGTAYGKEFSAKTVELTVSDIDGNVYTVIPIGITGHFWIKENLKVARYRNGDAIPTGLSNAAWMATTTGAYSIYNNVAANNTTYGKLYNYYAATDSRGLCPNGYHIPTRLDMVVAVQNCDQYLSGSAGGSMKATTLWNSPNTGATNISGFSAIGAGLRDGASSGIYFGLGDFGKIWSSTLDLAIPNAAFILNFSNTSATAPITSPSVRDGNSCRCVRDE